MVKDVVCGMRIDEERAAEVILGDLTYFFCSRKCKETFEKEPSRFISDPEENVGKITPE